MSGGLRNLTMLLLLLRDDFIRIHRVLGISQFDAF
jgi:hypothetical protein